MVAGRQTSKWQLQKKKKGGFKSDSQSNFKFPELDNCQRRNEIT